MSDNVLRVALVGLRTDCRRPCFRKSAKLNPCGWLRCAIDTRTWRNRTAGRTFEVPGVYCDIEPHDA